MPTPRRSWRRAQDVFNLGWKLAAVTQGTAPAWVLDTYETERRRIAAKLVGRTDAWFGMMSGRSWFGAAMRTFFPELLVYLLAYQPLQRRMIGFISQARARPRDSPRPGRHVALGCCL